MRTAGLYLRISKDMTGEGLAVERQRADEVRLIQQRGWTLHREYVDNDISGAYKLYAITTDDKVTTVEGAVRLPGRVHFVNLVFLGRGSAEGYVRYDNGEKVVGARVVIGSTMFDQFQTGETDANGFYRITDLPVGPLTLSATDKDGNVTFAASEIKTPG